jgi:flagellar biosynthesis protein
MTEEPRKVVGLRYRREEGLPRVILKGSGRLAEEMLTRGARGDGPPVVQKPELLAELYRLPVDAEIGPELFELVALLLVHVYAVDESRKGESQ